MALAPNEVDINDVVQNLLDQVATLTMENAVLKAHVKRLAGEAPQSDESDDGKLAL